MDKQYDVAVIGGGAGGLFSSAVAKALGAKTVIIEKKRLGGDCTWYGCMPSKAILKSAEVAQLFKKAQRYGLDFDRVVTVNTSRVMDRVRGIVADIATHHEPEDLEKRGIHVIIGSPKFTGPQTVEVNNQRICAKRFILCTGSHPVVPPIDGLKDIAYLSNENLFDLKELPKSIIVLGGGPIGVEMAQALCRLGVNVTLIEMDKILAKEDRELVGVIEERFREEGMKVIVGKKAVNFEKRNDGIAVSLEGAHGVREVVTAEMVLLAAGRAPNIEGLDLHKAQVDCNSKGIQVNAYLQTTNPAIFACGDIASGYQFSHVAAYQGSVAVRNALFKRIAWSKVNYTNITWATFTDPELAHLGLTEEEARSQYAGRVKVYTTAYTGSDRAITDGHSKGLMKVITDHKGYILGAHIVGANAGEIMQGFLIAKSQNIKLSKVAQTMFIYPTLSELVKKTAAKPLVELGSNPFIKFVMKIMRDV